MATAKLKVHTSIDITEDVRDQMCKLLNQQLADTFDLYSQIKQAHWNVKGPQFIQLHELFDMLASQVLPQVDEIAERVTVLGGTASGTARMAAKSSRLEDFPLEPMDGMACVEALAARYANVAKSTRQAVDTSDEAGDADSADLFTDISRILDKHLWFLEAHTQA